MNSEQTPLPEMTASEGKVTITPIAIVLDADMATRLGNALVRVGWEAASLEFGEFSLTAESTDAVTRQEGIDAHLQRAFREIRWATAAQNACEGISAERLEAGVVAGLLSFAREMRDALIAYRDRTAASGCAEWIDTQRFIDTANTLLGEGGGQ